MTHITGPATRASMPPMRRNGNERPEQQTLPEHRQKTVEAGLATYQQVLAERDELERALHNARLKIEEQAVQLNALNGVVTMMEQSYLKSKNDLENSLMQTRMELENRVSTFQSQRDEAVEKAAAYQTTLANLYVILRNTITEPDGAADHVGEK